MARNKRKTSNGRGACPAAASRARTPRNVTMCEGRSDTAESFFFRGRRRASTSTPVVVPWRTVIATMTPHGVRWRVSMRGSEIARRFASPTTMLSRIANKKEAEHASNAALLSVARLKASRAAGFAPTTRAAGSGKSGLALNCPPGGVLRRAQRASSQTANRNPKASHSANTPRAARLMARFQGAHQIGAWMVGEGG
jgi:hypothetical protein